ncbi:lipase chaperone [Photobacterium sp. WH77]|uniref:lipase secretion chaperone n=1 Tax=unclassified Photobacterium TaxID=2628852 RepID=UPI001C470A43|nr:MULTISPECIES: lipase secretion chaperone [unclassified Photobacterium]MBV7263215.1 lipase chaperone [Photobacterium sp. WH24]MCG2837995.1 lipase chaperone [Photobacterium sp. WH77]MCG2845613.1 lipase chaperone [Photobacterium sp. WH80]
MKKTVLSLIGVVAAASAVCFYYPTTSDTPVMQVPSQQDTKVDTYSSRDTFDYFLSGLGEADLETLKTHFNTYNTGQPEAYQLDNDLFERFIQYRAALSNLNPDNRHPLNTESLQRLNDQVMQIQSAFFSIEEQQRLFGEENMQRQLALRQLELKDHIINQDDYYNAWEQEINTLPPVMQQSYRNAAMLSQLQATNSLEEQDRYLKQQALVGPEAADRLVTLRKAREAFQTKLEHYFQQRDAILADNNLAKEEEQQALNDLRQTTFTASQIRRVQALESIRETQSVTPVQ